MVFQMVSPDSDDLTVQGLQEDTSGTTLMISGVHSSTSLVTSVVPVVTVTVYPVTSLTVLVTLVSSVLVTVELVVS